MTTIGARLAFVAALGLISACGSDDGSTGSGGSGGQSGSAGGGAGGSSGSGGSSAAAGSGGSIDTCCPAQPPADGDSCSGCGSCTYLDCSGAGRVDATCTAALRWQVATAPCAPVDCGGTQCAAGQVCVEKAGGALLMDCADNPCVGQALSCACGAAICPGTCMGWNGTTLSCNTCPSGQCP